jgi:hypothetical protein
MRKTGGLAVIVGWSPVVSASSLGEIESTFASDCRDCVVQVCIVMIR